MSLGKITLPPAPKPSKDLDEHKRNVEQWSRQVEQTCRAFERAGNDLEARLAALESP